MKTRHLLVLLAALAAGGCASMADKMIARVGGPERGFLTPAIFSDADGAGAPARPVAADACATTGCPQASGFCIARGYRPGSDGYARCIVSVEQNLRTAALRK